MQPMSEQDQNEIPRAAREAAEEGAPGYGTALLAVAIMVIGAGVLALLIYLLMIAISPTELREGRVRTAPRPAMQAPAATPPAELLPVAPAK